MERHIKELLQSSRGERTVVWTGVRMVEMERSGLICDVFRRKN